MEPADNRAAGKTAQAFSLALGTPHHPRITGARWDVLPFFPGTGGNGEPSAFGTDRL